MKFTLLILALLLTSCDNPTQQPWQEATEQYVCDEAQFQRVKDQTSYCRENTDYNGQYCMGAAMMAHCTKRVVQP